MIALAVSGEWVAKGPVSGLAIARYRMERGKNQPYLPTVTFQLGSGTS